MCPSDIPSVRTEADAVVFRDTSCMVRVTGAADAAGIEYSERSIFGRIDPAEFERLEPLFERVTLGSGAPLEAAGEPLTHVYVPDGGVASTIVTLADGEMVEAGLVGMEGLVGIGFLFGGTRALMTSLVQIPGPFFRCRADDLIERLDEFPALRQAALAYSGSFLVCVAQVAACNATHSLRQRMARWLLMAQDRVGRDRFRLTHEFIATMINVRRAGVSQFASEMRAAGAISYTRGEIHVTNRTELERESCECYDIIKRLTMQTGNRG